MESCASKLVISRDPLKGSINIAVQQPRCSLIVNDHDVTASGSY